MAGRFLIDVTDPRFSVPENEDVLEFIRRANPFAHPDVGSLLFELGKQAGAPAYCPAVASCAYVVLHNAANRIFAIAYGQRGLALRLPDAAQAEAVADGGVVTLAIGPQWVRFEPWSGPHVEINVHLRRWTERSFAAAA